MVSRKQRELLKKRKRRRFLDEDAPQEPVRIRQNAFERIYHGRYKQLLLITVAMLLFSLAVIGYTFFTTGDVINKGVSLSGGLTLTVRTADMPLKVAQLEEEIAARFPEVDFVVREVSDLGTQTAIAIEAATPENTPESLDALEDSLTQLFAEHLPDVEERVSAEIVGPSLGQAFFRQTAKAVLIAFVFMGLVVFLYFGETLSQKAAVAALTLLEAALVWYAGSAVVWLLALVVGAVLVWMYIRYSIPSAAVILAAVSTILFTIAIVDLAGMRISTAGIAAFLMLIGYSVDTDILLSTRVLKRKGGSLNERIMGTIKTGLTMELTTMIASLVAIIFTQSEVIREIMLIIFIGLAADILFTWIQNVGILRLYLERKGEAQ